ncbi:MAG: phosphate ABC transporter substrate-binding protein [Firmicutes bacterium HGW-Firmicutes-2]|jgi:phosphate transport system substrate-binding protein|nr:MAG: phosphate ABC transporter substrate-binding protein [Firmicutes bacterium HGW-Firmicutes-2]
MKKNALVLLLLSLVLIVAGCGKTDTPAMNESTEAQSTQESQGSDEMSQGDLVGEIRIDGSSTVFPITEAVAEEFLVSYPNIRVPVGISGSGGGFKKFIANETDISNASRPIKKEEAEAAAAAGIEFIEIEIAYDGLSVLVNPENDWVDYLSVEELEMIWNPDSTVSTWKDVRAEWPDEVIKLYAPGTDSGTFDYFTEEINGESGAIRPDFIGSEDDNVLVQGIAGDKNALGFFGYAYYEENQDVLKIVPIDGGSGPVVPTFDTIKSGEYTPLSRPLFVYVNKASLAKEEVKIFLKFYIENAGAMASEVGYVALPDDVYQKGLDSIQ